MSRTDSAPGAQTSRLFELADRVVGFMPADEGQALYDAAVRHLDGGVAVEIGTYCGKSTVLLGAAARRPTACCTRSTITTAPKSTSRAGSGTTRRWWTRSAAGSTRCPPSAAPLTPPASTTRSSRWWASRPVVAAAGARRCSCCSSTAGTARTAAQQDFDGWAKWVSAGGALIIHDVFPDPRDGGRPPYNIYCRALRIRRVHRGRCDRFAAGAGADAASPGRPVSA